MEPNSAIAWEFEIIQTNNPFLYIDQHDCNRILCLKKPPEKHVHIVFKFEQKNQNKTRWNNTSETSKKTNTQFNKNLVIMTRH